MNILSSHAAANYYLQILKLCKSYILKELLIKRTTENDCRALVLRGTLEYLFDEIIAGECALALLQKEIKKD